jgi:hypothetical protein
MEFVPYLRNTLSHQQEKKISIQHVTTTPEDNPAITAGKN